MGTGRTLRVLRRFGIVWASKGLVWKQEQNKGVGDLELVGAWSLVKIRFKTRIKADGVPVGREKRKQKLRRR